MERNFVVRLVFWLVVVVVFLSLLLLLYSPLRHVLNLPMNNINELRHRRWWWGEAKERGAQQTRMRKEGRRPVQSIETSLWMLIANRISLRQWDVRQFVGWVVLCLDWYAEMYWVFPRGVLCWMEDEWHPETGPEWPCQHQWGQN